MWETTDPEGRYVVLTDERWDHVLDRHPYIGVEPKDVVATVELPHAHLLGLEDGEEWFYARGLGPSAWLRVVVHYEHGRGLVVTAFPRRFFP